MAPKRGEKRPLSKEQRSAAAKKAAETRKKKKEETEHKEHALDETGESEVGMQLTPTSETRSLPQQEEKTAVDEGAGEEKTTESTKEASRTKLSESYDKADATRIDMVFDRMLSGPPAALTSAPHERERSTTHTESSERPSAYAS